MCGNLVCRHTPLSDAGKRMAEIVMNVRTAKDWDDLKDGWMAFKLEDGDSDRVIYDSKNDAVWQHRNKASLYFYLSLRQCMHGMTPDEATKILAMVRVQSDRGRYKPTPDDLRDPIHPITREDYENELFSTKMNMPFVIPGLAEALAKALEG
jgi:hypothetical protein